MTSNLDISAPELHALHHALLIDRRELALLDVREARIFNAGHLNLARHAPLSTLELRIGNLVPRRTTAIVLIDEDNAADGPAAIAAGLLARIGYRDIRRLAGGLHAWRNAGLPTIDGYNTLVKAFADLVRVHYETPTLQVDALAERRIKGLPTTIVDPRPHNEYTALTISGAHNYPGIELALRRFSFDQADHLVAISCFSRTRGIIGATTLKLLGLSDHVAFVEDGVMEWGLRGYALEQNAAGPDADDIAPLPDADLRAIAEDLSERYKLPRIDADGLRLLQEDAARTTYLFDVRQTRQDDLSAIRSVAGGQLLMHFESHVGTRNSRIVLFDDHHGLRATVTAFWLAQLNQAEVYIFDGDRPIAESVGTDTSAVPPISDNPKAISVEEIYHRRDALAIVDVGPSIDFEHAHIPGAFFLLPASLAPLKKIVEAGQPVVFVSPDGIAAKLAARDALALWPEANIAWLPGGTHAWKLAGKKLDAHYAPAQLLTPFDDDWGSVMRVFGPRRDEAWHAYLEWEKTLITRVVADDTVQFQLFQ